MKLTRWTTLIIAVLLVAVTVAAGACSSKEAAQPTPTPTVQPTATVAPEDTATPAPGDQPPVIASLVANPTSVAPKGSSTVTCVASDPDGDTLSYTWTFTGGTKTGIGDTITWVAPNAANTYTVRVRVSDGKGGVTNASVDIAVVGTATPTPASTSTATAAPTPTPTPVEGSITIQPDGTAGKDAGVDEYGAGSKLGGDNKMQVIGSIVGYRCRMYIQFDLSSLPSGAVIESASLGLYYFWNEPSSVEGPVGVYKVTSDWNESLISWNSQPSFGSAAKSTVTVPAANTSDFVLWDITALVQGWYNSPATNYGVMLRDTNESTVEGLKQFYSSDCTVANQRPELIIHYHVPAP